MAFGAMVGWLTGYFINVMAEVVPGDARRAGSSRSTRLRLTVPAVIRCAQTFSVPESLRLNFMVESVTALLFAVIWSQSLSIFALTTQSLLGAFLILVAVIDLRYHLVLNILIFPAMVLTLLGHMLTPGANVVSALLGGAFGLAIFALAAFVRPGQLGGGDVKLATLIGLVFAFPSALWALMVGVFVGGIASIWLLTSQRATAQSQMAYAPFLVFGALVALLYNPVPLLMQHFVGF